MLGLFKDTYQKMLKKTAKNQEENTKHIKKNQMFEMVNAILRQGDSLFTFAQPHIYSLAQENNIAQKYNEEMLVTSDKNLCIGFKLFGYSYAAITPEEEIGLFDQRNKFLTTLDNESIPRFKNKKYELRKITLKSTHFI